MKARLSLVLVYPSSNPPYTPRQCHLFPSLLRAHSLTVALSHVVFARCTHHFMCHALRRTTPIRVT
jgi:hypothetical protein